MERAAPAARPAPQLRYTFAELSRLLQQDRRTVGRWLADRGVVVSKLGRERVVWLADLVAAFPEIEKVIAKSATAVEA